MVSDDGTFTKVRVPTEEAMTNALIEVAEKGQRKAYFTTGHQEPSVKDGTSEEGYLKAAVALENEGYVVETVSLLDRENVPKDASILIVAGPKTPLLRNEIEAIRDFLDSGGRVLVLLEPRLDHGMDGLWRRFGVTVGDDLVIDPNPAYGLRAPPPLSCKSSRCTRSRTN